MTIEKNKQHGGIIKNWMTLKNYWNHGERNIIQKINRTREKLKQRSQKTKKQRTHRRRDQTREHRTGRKKKQHKKAEEKQTCIR